MNLADPELELIDPTPNVHTLFLHFDKLFFWTKLASKAVVRWSKRMYSCAGICSYEGRGGLCDIALSEPLLKLRPRKDLIETLLHEMIHAYLFITCRDRERDGHGPNFKAHMYRINKSAGLNISIYHDFHDEVKLYLTHWWRCNGPCQSRKPFFGIVRRSQNSAPGPRDYWWSAHQKTCGGTFIKIKEPEKKTGKGKKTKNNNGNITKYINNNNNNKTTDNEVRKPLTPLIKYKTKKPSTGTKVKSNSGNTVVITQKNVTGSPNKISSSIIAFTGNGHVISNLTNKSKPSEVNETVRNVWANKQLPGLNSKPNMSLIEVNNFNKTVKPIKQRTKSEHTDSPPSKIKKIDDYFKKTASSLLSDLYGTDIKITQENNKIVAVTNNNLVGSPINKKPFTNRDLVDCPVCSQKVDTGEINKHLDECLNKEVIENLSKDYVQSNALVLTGNSVIASQSKEHKNTVAPTTPIFKKEEKVHDKNFKEENGVIKPINCNETIDLCNINVDCTSKTRTTPIIKEESNDSNQFNTHDVNRVKSIVKRITYDKHVRKSDNFIVPKDEEHEVDCGSLPSFLDEVGTAIKPAAIKIEPGTSKDVVSLKCPCCGNIVDKPMVEHLDECLAFFDNNTTVPEEGASTSFANNTIVIDDDDDEDDVFDETLTMNATGTKTPCPCCMEMIETAEMNEHLDNCLS